MDTPMQRMLGKSLSCWLAPSGIQKLRSDATNDGEGGVPIEVNTNTLVLLLIYLYGV